MVDDILFDMWALFSFSLFFFFSLRIYFFGSRKKNRLSRKAWVAYEKWNMHATRPKRNVKLWRKKIYKSFVVYVNYSSPFRFLIVTNDCTDGNIKMDGRTGKRRIKETEMDKKRKKRQQAREPGEVETHAVIGCWNMHNKSRKQEARWII